MDDGELVSCPVCSTFHLQADIQQHVQLHFLEEPVTRDEVVIDESDDDEEAVYCPQGCGALVLLQDLDSHEEAHRLQEQESQQLRLQEDDLEKQHELLQMKYGFSDKRPGRCFRCGEEGHWSRECPRNPAAAAATAARNRGPLPAVPQELTLLQQQDDNAEAHSVDVIPLLQACFQAQPKAHSMVYLSGPVGFHSSARQADTGWGCGYRNIQMQLSHLLNKNGAHQQALFGGCKFVPDIASLQAWLEVAWQAGFDPGGAVMFGGVVQGSRKWIGTTEAAALLRYQGCRALLVEFHGRSPPTAVDASGATVHTGVACDICQQTPIIGIRYKSCQTPNYDVCARCRHSAEGKQHAPYRPIGQRGQNQQRGNSSNSQAGPTAGATSSNGTAGSGGSQAMSGKPGVSAAVAARAAQDAQGTLPQLWGAGSSPGGRQHQQQQRLQMQQQNASAKAAANYAGQAAGGSSKVNGSNPESKQDKAEKHRALAEWVWEYFSTGKPATQQQAPQAAAAASNGTGALSAAAVADGSSSTYAAASRQLQPHSSVMMTDRSPLYLQHEGHSRTVVGIERTLPFKSQGEGGGGAAAAAAEYSLIILDPGQSARELLTALRSQQGWQKLVKRGMHSLGRHAEFQVLYTTPDPVPQGTQRDALKIIKAEQVIR